mmetsp:Transcript_20925/g.48342  ORF Transcript_20925/g.48342 Transcript_20925/m.48342 type:complete len:426 (-) Transcript_20925:1119-2396(-)
MEVTKSSLADGGRGTEELELTPRPVLPWEAEHTHHEHGDLALVDEPLFSSPHTLNPTTYVSGLGPHASAHPHAQAAVVPGTGEGTTSTVMRYVFIDGDGQIQEAREVTDDMSVVSGEAQGPPPAVHETPPLHQTEAQIEQTFDTAELGMGAKGAVAPLDSTFDLHLAVSGPASECKACRGGHVQHTCGIKGKHVQHKAKKLRPPAAPESAAVKVKSEPPKFKVEGAKVSHRSSERLSVGSETPAPTLLVSVGVKRETTPKKAASSFGERTAPSASGPVGTSKLSSHTSQQSPQMALATETSPSTPPAPAPTPEPPSPKPLPCCTYECCPNPLHTSGGWKRVTPETRAGGRDWTIYYGRLFCNACFTQYATTGSMTRKGRPPQENPYLAGGPMQIPTEKPRRERHERVHAGGMALRAIKETNRLDL